MTELVERGRSAIVQFMHSDQQQVDEVVTALAWSIYKPEHAKELAETAVRTTGLGNVEDKVVKNRRKTFGTLRDLMRVRTVGVIEQDPARGADPVRQAGGCGGRGDTVHQSGATPVNRAMMAIKVRNAVVIAPSPYTTTNRTVELMRAALG